MAMKYIQFEYPIEINGRHIGTIRGEVGLNPSDVMKASLDKFAPAHSSPIAQLATNLPIIVSNLEAEIMKEAEIEKNQKTNISSTELLSEEDGSL